VGAGIKEAEDVRVSLKLGSVGIAVASGIVKAENPKEKVMELARAFAG
jgi:triosephosphate isomerase